MTGFVTEHKEINSAVATLGKLFLKVMFYLLIFFLFKAVGATQIPSNQQER